MARDERPDHGAARAGGDYLRAEREGDLIGLLGGLRGFLGGGDLAWRKEPWVVVRYYRCELMEVIRFSTLLRTWAWARLITWIP